MKKNALRLLSLLLCLAICAGLLPGVGFAAETVASGTCGTMGSNLTWNLDSEGTLTISGEGGMRSWGSASYVPWKANRNQIKTVTLQSGVTNIGNRAFDGCDNLTSVTIPESVTGIGNGAFDGCSSLASVTIPDGVTSIGQDAFCDTALYLDESNWTDGALFIGSALIRVKTDMNGEYPIREGTTIIADGAFSDCSSLTGVTIPGSVTGIANRAFSGCSALTSVTIPESVTSIGDGAFSDCSALTSVTIPGGVMNIGVQAFFNCGGLTSVTIPESVTSIWAEVFCGCGSLTSVTIPASVTTIGDGAFDGCSALADVYYSGSEADWGNIYIGINNAPLSSAAIHYNSTEPGGETPLPGDVSGDGKVTAADAAALFAALCDPTAAKDPAVMDLNNDGKVNNRDAILLFRKAARGG